MAFYPFTAKPVYNTINTVPYDMACKGNCNV